MEYQGMGTAVTATAVCGHGLLGGVRLVLIQIADQLIEIVG
jgi:hypothetical protein